MTRTTPASTYDDDFFAWTQEQAAALRRLPSDAADVDIAHVAEEIEDLGKRDLREVKSYIGRLVEHLIKIGNCPDSRDVSHWRSETRRFAASATAAYSPSMRQLIDMGDVWDKARRRVTADLKDAGIPVSMPTACPFALEDLLDEAFDVDAAKAILTSASS